MTKSRRSSGDVVKHHRRFKVKEKKRLFRLKRLKRRLEVVDA